MNNKRFYTLLIKDRAGSLSTDEKAELEKYLIQNPEAKSELDSIDEVWNKLNLSFQADGSQVFENIQRQMQNTPVFAEESAKSPSRMRKHMIMGVAASVLLIMLSSLVAFFFGYNFSEIEKNNQTSELTTVKREVQKGQKLKVFLPDGSNVWLNSNSKLTYPEEFGDVRSVYLEGEAFFSVARDEAKPFHVISEGVTTTALGTSFNVNAHNGHVEVALVTGKVEVKNANNATILNPGEKADVTGRAFSVREFDQKEITSWKDGIIFFKEASFNEVIRKLENWYGVEFLVKNAPKTNITYSGSFDNAYLSEVLEGMAFVYDFKFKIEKKNATIVFK